jgi:hypothetical protein
MVAFVFTTILMVSLSTVLYLVVRALPRIVEDPSSEKSGLLDRWARSQIPEKVDATLNGFLLKFLRRAKVFVMKIDNSLSKHLQKVKPEETDKKPNIDFKEMANKTEEPAGEDAPKI